jgi:hypothetical protein
VIWWGALGRGGGSKTSRVSLEIWWSILLVIGSSVVLVIGHGGDAKLFIRGDEKGPTKLYHPHRDVTHEKGMASAAAAGQLYCRRGVGGTGTKSFLCY